MPDYNPFCDSPATTAKPYNPPAAAQTDRIAQEKADMRGCTKGPEVPTRILYDLRRRRTDLNEQLADISQKLEILKGLIAVFE